jgi:ribosome-binding factor A
LNELILQTVSQVALTLKDPGIGFITITGCDTSADVSLSKIFYSILGSPEEKEATAQALERAKPYIRGELAKLENLRRVPNIMFVFDDAVERADRVNRILHNLHQEKDSNGSHSSD